VLSKKKALSIFLDIQTGFTCGTVVNKIGWTSVDSLNLAQDIDKWLSLLNTIMNFLLHKIPGIGKLRYY
jgi:hypothetical protein